MHLWRTFILRKLWREPFRALATLFGISLGIAVIAAIELAKTSSVESFRNSIDQMAGRAALEITTPGGVREERLTDLVWLREFGLPCPVVEGDAVIETQTAKDTLRILGIDILRDQEVRDYELVEFADGRRQPTPTEFLSLLSDPHAIILTEKFARRHGWKVGDTVPMLFGDSRLPMRVTALLLNRGAAQALDGNVALMDIAAAQTALNKVGRIDRLELKLREGTSVESAEQSVAQRLPAGLEARRPQRRGAEIEKMMAAYHFNLTLLSGIAFLAGLYVIYNSVSLSVIGRRKEIGMLRTVGASRRTIAWLFLGEALMLSIPGCLLGLALGAWLARFAVALTQTTMTLLYTQHAPAVAVLTWKLALPLLALGAVLSLIAALRPALEASRVPPVEAVRDIPDARDGGTGNHRALFKSLLLIALGAGACWLPPIKGLPVGGALACLLGVGAGGYLVPMALRAALRLGRPLFVHRLGVAGELAWASLAGGVKRLSIPVGALGGTLALAVAIAVMVGSFRQTLLYWVEQSLAADIYIRSGTRNTMGVDSTLSPETIRIVSEHPAIETMDIVRGFDMPYEGARIILIASNYEIISQRGKLAFKGLADWRPLMMESRGKDAVAVSEAFSLRYKKKTGDVITLPTPHGQAEFRIFGIYFDYSNDRGAISMDRATYERHFGKVEPTTMALYLKPAADVEAVREELLTLLGPNRALIMYTNRSLRVEVLRIFESTFSVTWALEAISIIVAMAGVATTIFTLVLERRNEIAILRQLGAGRGQLRRAVALEAGFLGLASQIMGIVIGFGLSFVLIYVINVQSFGWTLQFHPPWMLLLQFTVLPPMATAIAGWLFSAGILRAAAKKSDQIIIRE